MGMRLCLSQIPHLIPPPSSLDPETVPVGLHEGCPNSLISALRIKGRDERRDLGEDMDEDTWEQPLWKSFPRPTDPFITNYFLTFNQGEEDTF